MRTVSKKEYELMRRRNTLWGNEEIYNQQDWAFDREDPDNWIVIPEFNVAPASVAFKGFRFPIVEPEMENFGTAESMRYMLTTARMKVRTLFSTRKELMQQVLEAADLDIDAHSTAQKMACAYLHFEQALADAHQYNRPGHADIKLMFFADAGEMLAAFLADDHEAVEKLFKLRSSASKGGKRSSEVRKQSAIKKEEVVDAAKKRGWPDRTHGINKAVGNAFDLTPAYVGEILRSARKV